MTHQTVSLLHSLYSNVKTNQFGALLKGTVFHTTRFDRYETVADFDPRQSLNTTEAMLNEVLANITISAISLGTWWEGHGTSDEYQISQYILAK